MNANEHPVQPRGPGFTLVEVLVSMTLLLILLIVLVSMTNSVAHTWTYTTGKIEEFRNAREAFEAITRRLSQATLNTYWDYQYPLDPAGKPDITQPPIAYIRQSELRFISGNSAAIAPSPNHVTHSIFFQAALGDVNNSSYQGMETLLNTCGYYLEFADDSQSRPDFINAMTRQPSVRHRFRLMEMTEPSETLTLFSAEVTAKQNGVTNYTGKDWFTTPLSSSSNSRVLAENIIALVILPKLTVQEDPTGAKLCPRYSYDSTTTGEAANLTGQAAADLNTKNQLSPIVQVTLVAVDETSFSRIQTGTAMPDLGLEYLFQEVGDLADESKPGYAQDLKILTNTLRDKKMNYRVFTTNVAIRGAKWSRDQKN